MRKKIDKVTVQNLDIAEQKKCDIFVFLWFNENGKEFNKFIKAKNINSAIKKFLSKKPISMHRIDYEVQNGNKYIDISDRTEFSEYL